MYVFYCKYAGWRHLEKVKSYNVHWKGKQETSMAAQLLTLRLPLQPRSDLEDQEFSQGVAILRATTNIIRANRNPTRHT